MISEILKRKTIEVFAKWVDLQTLWRSKGEKAVRQRWTKAEDEVILKGVAESKSWVSVARQLCMRNPKQCRDRYVLHLDPKLNKNVWTHEEDAMIVQLYNRYGSRWSFISKMMNGRSDNAIKNRFNGFIKK